MPYKDKEKRKAVNKESMKKSRGTQKGTQEEGVHIPEGVTLYRYIDGKKVILDKVPEGHKVLSDGQVWKPRFPTVDGLPQHIIDDIEKAHAYSYRLNPTMDSLEKRYENAYKYLQRISR